MLYVYTQEPKESNTKYIDDVENDFEIMLLPDGLHNDGITRDILNSIDKVDFVDAFTVRNSNGESFSLSELSSGCKSLILAVYFPDYIINYDEASNGVINKTIVLAREANIQIYIGYTNVALRLTSDTVVLDGAKLTIAELSQQLNKD